MREALLPARWLFNRLSQGDSLARITLDRSLRVHFGTILRLEVGDHLQNPLVFLELPFVLCVVDCSGHAAHSLVL